MAAFEHPYFGVANFEGRIARAQQASAWQTNRPDLWPERLLKIDDTPTLVAVMHDTLAKALKAKSRVARATAAPVSDGKPAPRRLRGKSRNVRRLAIEPRPKVRLGAQIAKRPSLLLSRGR
jgi:hypothetical protein